VTGAAALTGGFADAPVEAAQAFRAALQAMARPGHIFRVTGVAPPAPLPVAAGVLALTLCDPDTPLWLAPDLATDSLAAWLTFHTGAPIAEDRGQAAFGIGAWQALAPIDDFAIGTPDYPDRSATLIVLMDHLSGDGPALSGPGIRERAHLSLPETVAFQRNAALFPQGLDFFFCAGDRLAALPRTTRVEG